MYLITSWCAELGVKTPPPTKFPDPKNPNPNPNPQQNNLVCVKLAISQQGEGISKLHNLTPRFKLVIQDKDVIEDSLNNI